MKKNVFLTLILLLSSILYYSCNNDDDRINIPPDESELIPVSFRISDFGVDEITNMRATRAIKDNINTLYYLVYKKKDESFYKEKIIRGTDLQADYINDSLPKGDYIICFIATPSDSLELMGTAAGNIFQGANILASNDEIFYDNFSISILDPNFKKSVSLPRITGKVEIKIKDAQFVPEEIERIQVASRGVLPSLYNLKQKLTMGLNNASGSLYESPSMSYERDFFINANVNPIELHFIPLPDSYFDQDKVHMSLRAYKAGENMSNTPEAYEKKLTGLVFYPNKITKMSGYLYDDAEAGFSVSVSDSYDETIEIEDF